MLRLNQPRALHLLRFPPRVVAATPLPARDCFRLASPRGFNPGDEIASSKAGKDAEYKPKTFKELAQSQNNKDASIFGFTRKWFRSADSDDNNILPLESKRLQARLTGSRELMSLTWKESFFYGHRVRSISLFFGVLILPVIVRTGIQFFDYSDQVGICGSWLTLLVVADFYLSRICTNILYDPSADVYFAYTPFSFDRLLSFKASHVTEVGDGIFSTIAVRGRKLFAPRALFHDVADYDALVKGGGGEDGGGKKGVSKLSRASSFSQKLKRTLNRNGSAAAK